MNPKDLSRRAKTVTKLGEWKVVTGKSKMSKTAFPLGRRNGHVLGRKWHWRVDHLEADGAKMRLLTAHDFSHDEFLAWLSLQRGDVHVIVAQLEYHAAHGPKAGLHCHSTCGDIEDIDALARPRSFIRFPGGKSFHRRKKCPNNDATALSTSFRFFNVSIPEKDPAQGTLL